MPIQDWLFTKARIFLIMSLATSIGLGFGFDVPQIILLGICLVSVVLISLGWGKTPAVVLGFMGIIFCISAQWSHMNKPPDFTQFNNSKSELTLVIITDPETKDKSINALGQIKTINSQEISGEVALVLPRYPEYSYGTLLKVKEKLEAPTEFNRKDNVVAQIVFPEIFSAEPGHGNKIKEQLYKLKKKILVTINTAIPDPENGLMGGLLLGTRKLPQEVLENFRTTGTAHIVAVSGFNVTIVAAFLDKLLRRFGRSTSFYASVLAIFGFVIITGASASVVRAGLMGCLGLLATQAGRLYSSSNSIVFASAIMLLQKPTLLKFDIGFQLSFAALAGLLYIQPRLEEYFPNTPAWIKSFAFPTLAAQVTTTPLSLYHFGNFSLISVFANVLVLPLIPIAMLLGFVAVIGYLVWPVIGIVFGTIVWLLLKYILWAIDITASIPLAALKNIPFPLWAFIIYYIILIALLSWKPKPKNS